MNINDLYNAINNEDKDIEQKVDININNNDKDLKCINCNTNTLVFYDGGTFCNICGLLQDVKFTNEQEYRYYGLNEYNEYRPCTPGCKKNDCDNC